MISALSKPDINYSKFSEDLGTFLSRYTEDVFRIVVESHVNLLNDNKLGFIITGDTELARIYKITDGCRRIKPKDTLSFVLVFDESEYDNRYQIISHMGGLNKQGLYVTPERGLFTKNSDQSGWVLPLKILKSI